MYNIDHMRINEKPNDQTIQRQPIYWMTKTEAEKYHTVK